LSRSSRLGTHTRSIQAHLRAARSSPPRPLWFCIVDMQSRFSEDLNTPTTPDDWVRSCISSVTTRQRANGFYTSPKRGRTLKEKNNGAAAVIVGCFGDEPRSDQTYQVEAFRVGCTSGMIVLCRFRHAHDLVVSRLRRRSLGSDSVDDLTIRPMEPKFRAHSPSGELQRDMKEPA
jgi:hypothetical protein